MSCVMQIKSQAICILPVKQNDDVCSLFPPRLAKFSRLPILLNLTNYTLFVGLFTNKHISEIHGRESKANDSGWMPECQ